ncbi:hypothetical protein ZHAS_00015851 [Anopheles sinensis]|uniref:Uncharacterized protein n=1 Tax=Anopheles sinensis TaxID=74873 RepID=A0A084WC35_ANOSI|nr:hypothetical protein ZHAS_00015851 [Anopheles sinensis]
MSQTQSHQQLSASELGSVPCVRGSGVSVSGSSQQPPPPPPRPARQSTGAAVESVREQLRAGGKQFRRDRRTRCSGSAGLPKCIITVQDTSGDVGVGAGGEDTAAATATQEGGAGSGNRPRRRWRRCKLATGARRGANQTTMLKYLTHKLRTQSINDENHANEKVSVL